MAAEDSTSLARALCQAVTPVNGDSRDFDPLMELIGDAHYVLIGEASHGTHEFYRTRALLTQRLIAERGFSAVAVEADWPDAYRVNRYIRGTGDGETAVDALAGFERFPTWMWRNADVLDFVGWLREQNDDLAERQHKAGFYGLDLYSLYTSIAAVIRYLEQVDPAAAARARERYACFEHFGMDAQTYGYLTGYSQTDSCEDAAVQQLVELQRHAAEYAQERDGQLAEDEYFYAQQNALVAQHAEEYYRAMYRGRVNTWNLRDSHMADTLDALVAHLGRDGIAPRVVVWAHNSHVGDARATEAGRNGELNLGQLVRERHGDDVRLIGFATNSGTVSAADDWDEPVKRKRVRPAMAGSYEKIFHEVGMPGFLLTLRGHEGPAVEALHGALHALHAPHLERAIGVIYRPETERYSHYFYCDLPAQFDALIYFDETRAVEPLERMPQWETTEEVPETYPSAL